jgi:methylated-DNA-[protein]-cysteine S-methyltransferase
MKEDKINKQLRGWLGDTDEPEEPEVLLDILDDLYAEGPGSAATIQAQANLRNALSRSKPNIIYYDEFFHNLIGTIYIAQTEMGLFAVDFGTNEEDFVQNIERESKRVALRSQQDTETIKTQLREYLNGERTSFDVNIDLSALTEFHKQVLLAAWQIPHGEVATYGEIARRIGKPKAARAVGQALGRNPMPIVIPCHRVIASDGSLGGYSGGGGLETKAKLLALEHI